MKALTLLAVLIFSFGTVWADSEIDEVKAAQPLGLVKIKVLRGEVEIEGWQEDKIQVEGDLDELATGFRFEVNGDRAEIEVEMPNGNVNWGDGSDLVIRVPEMSRVAVDSVATDVRARGLIGGSQIRTISGEIDFIDGEGKVSLKTISGRIQVEDSAGDLRVTSSSGDIDVASYTGNAFVETMSGEIELDARRAKQLRGTSISGEIDATVSFLPGASAEFSSVSGEIRVTVDNPSDLSIVANTMSGEIDNDLTEDRVIEKFGQKSLRTQIGNGEGTLGVRAVSGAIELSEG